MLRLLEFKLVLATYFEVSMNWTYGATKQIELDCSSEQFEKETYYLYLKDFELLVAYYCDVVLPGKGRYH